MPGWLINIVSQFPIVVIVGGVAWYAYREVKRANADARTHARQVHDAAVAKVESVYERIDSLEGGIRPSACRARGRVGGIVRCETSRLGSGTRPVRRGAGTGPAGGIQAVGTARTRAERTGAGVRRVRAGSHGGASEIPGDAAHAVAGRAGRLGRAGAPRRRRVEGAGRPAPARRDRGARRCRGRLRFTAPRGRSTARPVPAAAMPTASPATPARRPPPAATRGASASTALPPRRDRARRAAA